MLKIFKKKTSAASTPKETIRQRSSNDRLEGLDSTFFTFEGRSAPLAVAFVSPHVDFHHVSQRLAEMAPGTQVIAVTTAGELCSEACQSVYLEANDSWNNVVLQVFSPHLVENVEVYSIPLHCEDIRAGHATLDHDDRVDRISSELAHIHPGFSLDAKQTIALTFIDGLSKSENYLMEAIYNSGQFPCLFVGGSAGGKLDFQNTWIFNGKRVVENHAVVAFIRLATHQRYGLFKSQNFNKTHTSYVVLEADPNQRTVTSVYDPASSRVVPLIDVLCERFRTTREQLHGAMSGYAFGIEIDGEIFVRSVANIDPVTGAITFYCDCDIGDQLIILEETDFLTQTRTDISAYFSGKPKPAAILLNDCILRRLSNQASLPNARDLWPAPAAGFSTFGELFGININQTLSAVVFFSDVEGEYADTLIDNFPIHYAKFSNYFSRRKMMRLQREQMRVGLHQAFGQVIDAGVEGDFSLRVTREFPDMELNRLAKRVNMLVETVHNGLEETGAVLSALADADLTQRVQGQFNGAFDKLKTDTNEVAETLTQIVGRLSEASQTLKTTTGELLDNANDLSDRTSQQTTANRETSQGVGEMARSVRVNAEKAASAASNTEHMMSTAEISGSAMSKASEAMNRIIASSTSISNIANMIDEIAFKTNLLALNAAVEAARVGDEGRGFAVVAGEVRQLAASSAAASAEVKALINQSVAEVKEGGTYVAEAETKLSEMLSVVRQSNELMKHIAQASTAQSMSIKEVNNAVAHMDNMTRQNATLVEEIHAAIAKTEAQANEMDEIVKLFLIEEPQPAPRYASGKPHRREEYGNRYALN